ncbi:MAG: alanine racemase [Clostridia bacterium]|jgi:alanine racemase|nr:alanine racemase [Clostridia bacterium]
MENIRPIWLEINLDAIAHNVKKIRQIVGKNTQIIAVVKANAYGHGAIEVSETLLENGVTMLGVGVIEEGVVLREAGIKAPILVCGLTKDDQLEPLVMYNLSATVCRLKTIQALSRIASKNKKKVPVHIKIDTGMGRLGIPSQDTLNFVKEIGKMKNIEIEGIFTHFAATNEEDGNYTRKQFEKYKKALLELERERINIPVKHVANSTAILNSSRFHLNAVRPGIIVYGLFPSPRTKQIVQLRPAAEFKTKIIFLKEVSAGKSIGYGKTFATTRPTRIATLPVGYADGYSWLLSNKGEVLVRGQRAPIIGRICMDLCMIDVTHIGRVQIGDEVVLWGKQGSEMISAEEVAQKMGSIVYEVICMVDKERVPKVFIKNGKPFKVKSLLGNSLLAG